MGIVRSPIMAKKAGKKINNEPKKVLDDKKINIMLLGTSGSGKSTLINAFLNTNLEKAPTGIGTAITDRIDVYGDLSKLPFRLIDTPGLEYSHKRQNWLTKEIKKWLKDSVKNPDPKTIVHTIWFCVDGSTKRIPEGTLRYLQTVSDFWTNVPIIFVSTKTYFEEDVEENHRMIDSALNKFGRDKINVKAIISVLADRKGAAEPMGIEELSAITEQLGPEARSIFEKNWKEKIKTSKRIEANSVVLRRSAAAAAADVAKAKGNVSPVVTRIQKGMLNNIAKVYEVNDNNTVKRIVGGIMGSNAIGSLGKNLASKAVEVAQGKWKIAAKAVTATVSGVVTLTLGEIGIAVFESIFMGDLDIENADWDKVVEKIIKDKSFPERLKKIKGAIKNKDGDSLIDELIEMIGKVNITK